MSNEVIIDGFYRDPGSKAIINTNVERIAAYKKQREERLRIHGVAAEQERLAVEVQEIKQDLNDIKSILQEISKRL